MGQIITVNFRDDTLFAVECDDGVFVAVKPICDSLQVAWQSQLHRLKNDPVLSEGITTIVMPSPGGAQETTCLKLELVNGWLFKIDSRRVQSEEGKQKLITYQRECYPVLFRHFYGQPLAVGAKRDDGSASADEPVQTRRSLVTEARQTFGCQSARELWLKLGLPTTPSMFQSGPKSDLFTYTAIEADPKEAA